MGKRSDPSILEIHVLTHVYPALVAVISKPLTFEDDKAMPHMAPAMTPGQTVFRFAFHVCFLTWQ